MSYDVFLSHNSEDKPWVETLARNLKSHGVKPFLDLWDLKLGESFASGLQQALNDSRHGITICTPNTAGSYWLQIEYHEMLMRRQSDANFRMIPVLVRGDLPEFFGARALNAVNFRERSESGYRIAFRRLLCAVSGEKPDQPEEFVGDLEFPEFDDAGTPLANEEDGAVSLWTGGVMAKLFENRVLLLLAQADRLTEQERRSLFTHAHERFGADAVYRVHMPGYAESAAEFYEDIGLQCALPGTDSLLKFKYAFNRMAGSRQVMLVVFGFESCAENLRHRFGSCLRSIYDQCDGFHALIAGGRELHQLYVTGEEGSLFNVADAEFCPDPSNHDVRTEWTRRRPDTPDAATVASMLSLSGAHPRLLHECWNDVGAEGRLDTARVRKKLADQLVLARAFSASTRTAEDRQKCANILRLEVPGGWNNRHIPEPMGSLFWNNLLRRDGSDLRWRCDVVREVGKTFFESESQA